MPFVLQGIIPAVWTPTDAEGRVLKDVFSRNIGFLTTSGVDALLILGSTGEFVHLNTEQRKAVVEAAASAAGSTPFLVNISEVSPRNVAELARHAKACGAVGVTLLPPWFYPLADDDLVEFFVRSAEGAGLPLALYNFQAMTGKRLTPEVVERVAKRTQISGIKHSAGDIQDHKAFAEIGARYHFNVVTGWDTCITEAMALGAKGCIGGLANLVPEVMLKVHRASAAGLPDDAREAAEQMRRIGKIAGTVEFPINVAAAMEARGLEVGAAKSVVSPSTRQRYEKLRDDLRALLNELNIPQVPR